jgi:DNA-binding beta-propeller fold protein YncE
MRWSPAARLPAGLLLVLLLAGCAAPLRSATGGAAGGRLYVVDAGTGTLLRIDTRTGRPAGGPLPGGPAPRQAVAGPDGRVLVLPSPTSRFEALTLVVPAGRGWATRPLPVEPGARAVAASGDGGRYAALAYSTATGSEAPGCRLALLDLVTVAVVGTHRVCGPGESVRDVALDAGPGGPVAYLALWGLPTRAPGGGASGRGRVVALAAETGAVLAAHDTAGHPERLLLGPEPGGGGRRAYFLETTPLPPDDPQAWRLVALGAATLAPEGAYPFPAQPLWPALAPDGGHAYALTDHGGGSGRLVVVLDLTTGAVSRMLTLPGGSLGLVADAEALYVLDPAGGGLRVVDRRSGRLRGTTAAGRTPVALALGPAG